MWILNKKEVGKRLKAARSKTGLTSRKYAMMAKIDQSQYLKMEKGLLSVTEKTMAKLVTTHHLEKNYILYGNNPPKDSVLNEEIPEYHVPLKLKVDSQEALLSILVNEVAALKAAASGEHSEVIIKKIYKAADDVIKLSKEE